LIVVEQWLSVVVMVNVLQLLSVRTGRNGSSRSAPFGENRSKRLKTLQHITLLCAEPVAMAPLAARLSEKSAPKGLKPCSGSAHCVAFNQKGKSTLFD
jgi:hypothetical protein